MFYNILLAREFLQDDIHESDQKDHIILCVSIFLAWSLTP